MDILDCCSKCFFSSLQYLADNLTYNNASNFNFEGVDTNVASLCGGEGIFETLVYRYVIYHPGHLSVFQTEGKDLISFGFQGCYMALFDYQGKRYGAHIAKDSGKYEDKDYSNNSVLLWNHLVDNDIIQCISMFDPTEAIPYCYQKHWGIIKFDGSCFAVIRDENNDALLVQNKTPLKGKQAIISV